MTIKLVWNKYKNDLFQVGVYSCLFLSLNAEFADKSDARLSSNKYFFFFLAAKLSAKQLRYFQMGIKKDALLPFALHSTPTWAEESLTKT